MKLHQDKPLFSQLVTITSEYLSIPEEFVEKDYFVYLLLNEITRLHPNVIFKGGTSLSKCHKIINRFSEDIDINFSHSGGSKREEKKKIKEAIIKAITNTKLELTNTNDIKTRRDFNEYKVSYPSLFNPSDTLKQHLLIESYTSLESYPYEKMNVSNYILDFLNKTDKIPNKSQVIDKYKLYEFEMKVQKVERTLIDKIFAICDYAENDSIHQNSRHLYDIHKIWSDFDIGKSQFLKLLNQVAIDRSAKPDINISAVEGYELRKKLSEIISNGLYQVDYETITLSLLYSDCTYDDVINSLLDIISRGYVPEKVNPHSLECTS